MKDRDCVLGIIGNRENRGRMGILLYFSPFFCMLLSWLSSKGREADYKEKQ